jgi:hypothetical protein
VSNVTTTLSFTSLPSAAALSNKAASPSEVQDIHFLSHHFALPGTEQLKSCVANETKKKHQLPKKSGSPLQPFLPYPNASNISLFVEVVCAICDHWSAR